MSKFVPPSLNGKAFNCAHCNAYAHQNWYDGYASTIRMRGMSKITMLRICFCDSCGFYSLWVGKQMAYPKQITVPLPNSDLPDEVKTDYSEAAIILSHSPRGSAALMRLAIEKLVNKLVDDKNDLDTNIGILVKNGLPSKVQKALDTVRVIGNHAVHPGKIDLKDKPDTAHQLFKLVNIIGHHMITEPKEIDTIFNHSVSEDEKKHIDKRDKS